MLVGLRSGAMLRAALQPTAGATGQPPDEVDMSAEAASGGDADMADAEGSEVLQPQQPRDPTDSFQLKQVPKMLFKLTLVMLTCVVSQYEHLAVEFMMVSLNSLSAGCLQSNDATLNPRGVTACATAM